MNELEEWSMTDRMLLALKIGELYNPRRVMAFVLVWVLSWLDWYNIHTYIYHPRFTPEGVAEASRIFSQTPTLPKLLSYEEYCRRDRWLADRRLIAVYLRCKYFYPFSRILRHPWSRERCYSFILSRTPHVTLNRDRKRMKIKLTFNKTIHRKCSLNGPYLSLSWYRLIIKRGLLVFVKNLMLSLLFAKRVTVTASVLNQD
jgi:hypothetical protein